MTLGLGSCSDSDYINAIPKRSPAVVSVDLMSTADVSAQRVLRALFQVGAADGNGVDISKKMYLFELPDGSYGLCAAVSSSDKLADLLTQSGHRLTDFQGCHFTTLGTSWLMGYSDCSLLVMGPVTVEGQPELMRQMSVYLNQDEDKGLRASRLFERLDTISAPIALVSQLQSLPEQMAATLSLGMPKGARPDQVYYAAGVSRHDRALVIHGQTFSFNHTVDTQIAQAKSKLGGIDGSFMASLQDSGFATLVMHVRGADFLQLLQASPATQTLLAGANAVIDINSIISTFDGEVMVGVPSPNGRQGMVQLLAHCQRADWLPHVAYWKKSVPSGASITDAGRDRWRYTSGSTSFCFGIQPDGCFYFGTEPQKVSRPSSLQSYMTGRKMATVINLNRLPFSHSMPILGSVLGVLGPIDTMVYTLE